jgi:hypothetical protein
MAAEVEERFSGALPGEGTQDGLQEQHFEDTVKVQHKQADYR